MRTLDAASVRAKNANRTPNVSSSHVAGPDSSSAWAKCSLPSAVSRETISARPPGPRAKIPLALGGQPVDDPRPPPPARGLHGFVGHDVAGLAERLEAGIERAVGQDAAPAEPGQSLPAAL